MTLEQLRIFLAVAEREHVTQAAEALHLTQSSVSAAITALERRHAVSLFNRVGRRIELSEAGHLLVGEARHVLAAAEAAETALDDLSGARRGRLRVYASQTISSYWLPGRLALFRSRFPHIELHLRVGNTAEAARAVIEGVADLGFVEGEIDEPALVLDVVARDRLAVVVGSAHPWASDDPLLPAEIAGTAWALRERGSGTRSTFEEALRAMGADPETLRIAMELPSNEAICGAVEASDLATAVSLSVAAAGIAAGRLRAVPLVLPERRFLLLSHRERRESRAAEAFRALLREPAGV